MSGRGTGPAIAIGCPTASAHFTSEGPATARRWGPLEASIRRTFEELQEWGLTATRISRPLSSN